MITLIEVDRFLRRTGMAESRFGREAVNDPRLVGDLRRGRVLTGRTAARVLRFMENWRQA